MERCWRIYSWIERQYLSRSGWYNIRWITTPASSKHFQTPAACFVSFLDAVWIFCSGFLPAALITKQCCDSTSCRTLFGRSDLGVVGSEPGEVLLVAGDQREQHDVSRGHEGQRVVRVSTLSGETISTFTGPALHFLIKESTTEIFGKVSGLCLTLSGLCSLSERASRRSWWSLAHSCPPGSECGSPVGPGVLGRPAASTAGRRSAGTTSPETPETGPLPAYWRGSWTTFSLTNITRQTRLWMKSIIVSKTSDMFESLQI